MAPDTLLTRDNEANSSGTEEERMEIKMPDFNQECHPSTHSVRKPFRDPMMRGGRAEKFKPHELVQIKRLESELARLNDGDRILRNLMIQKVEHSTNKWIDVGREAAEYLWNLMGKDPSRFESNDEGFISSRTTWGSHGRASGNHWNDLNERQQSLNSPETVEIDQPLESSPVGLDSFHLSPSEELPTANELIERFDSVRRYNARGLVDQDHHDPLEKELRLERERSESQIPTVGWNDFLEKTQRNVGWMMERMGLDPALFGWDQVEGGWKL